jgi:hypothetical protein
VSNYLNFNIPTFFAQLDSGFLYDTDPSPKNEKLVVEVFNFTSIPQRCGLFSVMTEYGSQHARVPIQYLWSAQTELTTNYPLDWLQLWDSMSYYGSANTVDYLKNRAAHVILKDGSKHKAKYMFTIDWCLGPQYNSGYGEMAAGHKSGHVLAGEGGQYFIQPNNRILWMDGGAFISRKLTRPDWKVFSQEFSCEHTGSKWVSNSDDEMYFYEFTTSDEKHGKEDSVGTNGWNDKKEAGNV